MRRVLSLILLILASCTGPRYTYTIYSGPEMPFGRGQWLHHPAVSPGDRFQNRMARVVEEEFRSFLGDSLLTLKELRANRVLPETLASDLSPEALRRLGLQSGCEYLIRFGGEVLSESAGGLNLPSNDPYYYATNEAEVVIRIFHLETGTEISHARVHATVINQGSHFDNPDRFPTLNTSSQDAMTKAARKLVRRYGRRAMRSN